LKIVNITERQKHLKEINSWLYKEWGHHDVNSTELDWFKKKQAKIDKKNNLLPIILVAIKEDNPVGTASIVDSDMKTHPELKPWMADVYVKEDQRKKGYGSRLVKRILKEAVKLDFNKIYLFTPDQRSFYEQLGWKPYQKVIYRKEKVDIMVYDFQEEGS